MKIQFVPILALATCLGAAPTAGEASSADDAATSANDGVGEVVEETITVTADRLSAPVAEVGSSVTVVDTEEIARRKQRTVADLLRTVPGVEVVRSGGAGQVTSVFIRGGSSSQTLVLLDGVRLNSATTGAFDFADLTTDGIERIEIVRGPQSSLYGSEAMAGVVHIFSRQGLDGAAGTSGRPRFSGLAEVGSRDQHRLRAALRGVAGRFDYALNATDQRSDAVSAASERDGNRERDPWENTTLAGRFGLAFAGDGRVDLSVRRVQGDVAVDGFDFILGPVDALAADNSRRALVASLTLEKPFGDRWRQTFRAGINDDELRGRDADSVFGNFVIDSRVVELSSQSDVRLSAGDVLSFGFSREEREGGTLGSFRQEVEIDSVFVHNRWAWRERFFLSAGGRWDDHSQFGDETTWRLAAARRWEAAGTRLHGSVGTGFKAPTLNDLFFPFFANPDLVPETSEAYDVGVEQSWRDGRLHLDLTWFSVDFENLIAFSFVTSAPENIAAATSRGIELGFGYAGESWRLDASYTYDETEDRASGAQLARRPERRATASLFAEPHPRLRATATVVAVADRIDSDGSVLDDYETVDLVLDFAARPGLRPYLRLENLLDEDYEAVGGFTSPGFTAAIGLEVEL